MVDPTILFLFLAVVALFIYLKYDKQKEDSKQVQEVRSEVLKELVESREERTNHNKFDEDEFWKLIDIARNRNSHSYKGRLGIFKDLINKLSPEQLIELDNLINHIVDENISYDLNAASAIIFKSRDAAFTHLLLNVFISEGSTFYNNACINPEMLVNKKLDDIIGRLYTDIIAELYLLKTNQLIPIVQNEAKEFSGEKWLERELPSKYPNLWKTFS